MSFGPNYKNKFMFNLEEGWTVGEINEHLEELGLVQQPSLRSMLQRNSHNSHILMLYTPINSELNDIHGYFIQDSELALYHENGWEFTPNQDEEVLT